MNLNRKLVRVLHRISVLVASDELLWSELGTLIREFSVKVEEPGSTTTTESEANDQSRPSKTTELEIEVTESCSKTVETECVVRPVGPAFPPGLISSKPTVEEHQRCVSHELVARLNLKRKGSSWAEERMRRKASGADHMAEIAPGDRAILETAKEQPDCVLWMNRPSAPMPDDLSLYGTVGGCFEALAAVMTIAASSHQIIAADRRLFEDVLRLGTEAQSAVREAIRRVGGRPDSDQVEAYWWIRNSAAEIGLFIERHLREEDPADPNQWKDLLKRINELAERVERRAAALRRQRKLFEKLRYQLEQAVSGDGIHLWESVAQTLEELIVDGVPPSNLEVRELLLPHLEVLPQITAPPKGFELVLRETRRFRDSLIEVPADEEVRGSLPIIEAAAELLRGQAVLLIGGESRSDVQRSIERILRLSELLWMPIKHSQHVSIFEQYVARPDVIVVLLAVRWSSHSCTDVRHICRKYDKPLVRLPGGYSPNQVATQIVNQCSWRLKRSRQHAS